jgi:plasmid stability protein
MARLRRWRIPALTVRNQPDAVHRALRARGGTEAEMRYIPENTDKPVECVRLGSALAGWAGTWV